MPWREGKPHPTRTYMIDCLVQNGQRQVSMVGPMACLSISFCVIKHYLDFSFVFSSQPASLGHRSQITEGLVLRHIYLYKKIGFSSVRPMSYWLKNSGVFIRLSVRPVSYWLEELRVMGNVKSGDYLLLI
jgi:hypothetical protein